MATAAGLVVALNFRAASPALAKPIPVRSTTSAAGPLLPAPRANCSSLRGARTTGRGALEVAGGGAAGMVTALSLRRSDLRRPAPSLASRSLAQSRSSAQWRSLAWARSLEAAPCPGRNGRAR